MGRPALTELERDANFRKRFFNNFEIDRDTGCAIWTGYINKLGYPIISGPDRKNMYAHRAAYLITHGELPSNPIRHKCNNKLCVNTAHLYLTKGGVAELPEKCKHGHLWANNLKISTQGHRQCRVCLKDAAGRAYAKSRVLLPATTYWPEDAPEGSSVVSEGASSPD